MKTYRNLDAFEKRVRKSTDWADYFTLGGRMYKLYEYGDTYTTFAHSYVYFVNKRTHDAINVEYVLPEVSYKNEIRTEKGEYRLLNVSFIPNMVLWRDDTL